MKLQEKLAVVQSSGTALLGANFYNLETLTGIIQAAEICKQPVILQLTKSSIEYIGLETAVCMARTISDAYRVESWIHLDHGDSVLLVKKCLEAGFDSVMYDGSELSFEQNIENTLQVVELAKPYGANVEAELGYIAKLGQSTEKIGFTEPEEASAFTERTGVHALAIAIGTAHGFYKEIPKLDFERLKKIHAQTDAFLVLHGGSGIPDESVMNAIKLGICKINMSTETKNLFMRTLKSLMARSEEIDLRKVFPPAIQAVRELIIHKLNLLSLKY